jgi:hypothetical protein
MLAAAPQPFRSSETAVRVKLAVSLREVALRGLTGREDVLLAEGDSDDPALVLRLLTSLVRDDDPIDFAALPIPDIDALIVALRRRILGDRVVSHVSCANAVCGAQVDVVFHFSDYLAHHRPKGAASSRVRPLADRGEPGWFALFEGAGGEQVFRLPNFGDLIVVESEEDRAGALAARCLGDIRQAGERRRALRAMEALAPPLTGPIQGRCPDCGLPIDARFEARVYCLRELSDRARFVYDDVDALAAAYHWSEAEILDLPSLRRRLYAERIRQTHAS